MISDLRHALRAVARRPGWAGASALTLALGVGANAAMFAVVDRLLVRGPAGLEAPDRLVRFGQSFDDGAGGRFTMSTTSYPVFRDVASVAGLRAAAGAEGRPVLGSGGGAREVRAARVSPEYFALLGATPSRGRFIGEGDDDEPVAVVSYAFGHAERTAIGDALLLDGVSYRVVGVASPDFTGDDLAPVDVWLPIAAAMAQTGTAWREQRGMRLVRIVARLEPGAERAVVAEQATAQLRQGDEATTTVELAPLTKGWRGLFSGTTQERIAGWVAGMSVVVLLIAVVNVANLALFRAAGRRRETAVRIALGAGRAEIVRQGVAENLVVAAIGGVAALFLAAWASEAVRAVLLPGLAASDRLLSPRLVAITMTITLVAGLLAGLAPARRAGRPDLVDDLRTGTGSAGERTIAPAILVSAQAALCMVLLTAAVLFVVSLQRVRGQDFGFEAGDVLVAEMHFPEGAPGDVTDPLYRQAAERLRTVPGVVAATVAQVIPFSSHNVPPIAVPGRPDFPDERQQAPFLNAATPDFFSVLGMRLLQGRNFTPSDRAGSELVLIINQAMAEGLWPGESPLGRCVRVGFEPGGGPPMGIHASPAVACRTVVGVVNNARPRSIREEPGQARMQYYVPFGQIPDPPFIQNPRPGQIWALLVKTRDASSVAEPVQQLLQSFSPGLPYADVHPLQDLLDRQMRPWKLGASMFTAFGLLALGLAAVGLYGVRAYAVARRTREIGVRIALGARPKRVVGLILREGLLVSGTGMVLGLVAILFLGPTIEPLLFETSARDPSVIALVAVVLLTVAALASAIPAWRAARVDPNVALRSE